MAQPAISARAIGKEYRIVRARDRYPTLREAVARAARGEWRSATENFVALRDVSFDMNAGEIVGIVGGNGAGKSTLLKILSRVTRPTAGRIDLRGRVGSLLEVGTGFHPELTGRENVFLNGAILGMRRTEIARNFDAIVAFAEVHAFIDTPVKRYSSGMHLRLAFAVAAHLEPEILVVDEVLAVGDAAFQRKCLGKMQDVAHSGRTVLLVSHNMDAITRLCPRSILLERGRIVRDGPSAAVVADYLSRATDRSVASSWIDLSAVHRSGTGEARFDAARYRGAGDVPDSQPHPYGPFEIDLAIRSDIARRVASLAVLFRTRGGTVLIDADILSRGAALLLKPGRNVVTLRMEQLYLNPGIYSIGLWLGQSFGAAFDCAESAFEVEVVAGMGGTGTPTGPNAGIVPCELDIVPIDSPDAAQIER